MRSQAEQLKTAETLLAEIQHGRRAVPESLRRLIRDYFSDRAASVSGMFISETKPHKVDDARIAEIFNREPTDDAND